MTIIRVHYGRLVNTGNYNNERVGVWADVGEAESPEEILLHCVRWVDGQIDALRAGYAARKENHTDLKEGAF